LDIGSDETDFCSLEERDRLVTFAADRGDSCRHPKIGYPAYKL
jgi:hypothetical protein